MKTLKLSLVLSTTLLLGNICFAQPDSDDPKYNNYPVQNNNSRVGDNIDYNQLQTLLTNYAICENDSVTLSNNSIGCTGYFWSTDSAGNNILATDSDYTTGTLTSDTSYYITEYNTIGNGNAPMPTHSSTYSGNVRGYWFQAPIDFTITGFYVPTEASTGSSNVACVKFNSGAPPLWSTTTNDFTLLGLWQNETADTISSCIQVTAGDYIGILGNRNDQNSYSPSPSSTTIDGNTVTITRLGMQYNLSTTAPQDIFQESGGSISRVEFFYSTGVDSASAIVTQVDVTVNSNDYVSVNTDICQGDSILLEGAYQNTAGIYQDTLTNMTGCDSIVTTDLAIIPDPSTSETTEICQGDSILVHGNYENSAGIYTDTFQAVNGCDSVSTVEIIVNSIPATPTIDPFSPSTVCSQNGIIPCPAGTPTGGIYTGNGVSGTDFDPATAGVGTHTIGYVIVDSNNCESDPATTTITVNDCASINENTLQGVSIYPNPTEKTLFIEVPLTEESITVEIFDAAGKLITRWNEIETTITYDMSKLSEGMYVVHVQSDNKEAQFKVTKK